MAARLSGIGTCAETAALLTERHGLGPSHNASFIGCSRHRSVYASVVAGRGDRAAEYLGPALRSSGVAISGTSSKHTPTKAEA